MESIIIREANINDLETLLEFEQSIIEAERPLNPFLKKSKINFYNIKEILIDENALIIVAVSNEELVGSGYVKIEDSEEYQKNKKNGYIGFMYVKPSFRGQRISSLVLENLKSWAKSKEIKELRLDVYNSNVKAIKAYEHFGFNKALVNMRMEIL